MNIVEPLLNTKKRSLKNMNAQYKNSKKNEHPFLISIKKLNTEFFLDYEVYHLVNTCFMI